MGFTTTSLPSTSMKTLRQTHDSMQIQIKRQPKHTGTRTIATSLYSTKDKTEHKKISANNKSKSRKKRISTKRSWINSATTITGKWRQNFEALEAFAEQHQHTRVPYNYPKNPRLGRWVMRQRTLYNEMQSSSDADTDMKKVRPANVLTEERIEALQSIGFLFEFPRKCTWNKRFDELCQYRALFGDCLVPLTYEDVPGLGVWVRTQRTQYRNLLLGRKTSNLSPEKIAALKSLGFVWDTQRNDQWKKRFDELVDFKDVYRHCSVPMNYHENQQLGTWVANQRTAYKNVFAGSSGLMGDEQSQVGGNASKGLTREKIAALESIGFCWDQTTYNWYSMYERLKRYKQEKTEQFGNESVQGNQEMGADDGAKVLNDTSHHKYFHVPPEDVENRDLRLWIAVQRREYSNLMHNKNISDGNGVEKRSSMTPRRKRALEEINFPFSSNKQKYGIDGPTVDDWTKLFEQMREKGIDKDARPKEHWFEGQSIFGVQDEEVAEKDQWTDDDLLELWNMEDDE